MLDRELAVQFDKKDLTLGIALQLPLYAMVIEEKLGLKAVSAELYSIKDKKPSGFYHRDYADLFPKSYSRRMMLEDEDFKSLLERIRDLIRKYSRGMAELKIPVKPRKNLWLARSPILPRLVLFPTESNLSSSS